MKKIATRILVFILVMVCVLSSVHVNVNAAVSKNSWSTKASMTVPRQYLGAGT